MEYMASGTPIVTTDLPGMPSEYKNFVYIFNNETVDGMYNTLKTILSQSRLELHNFGHKAKQFIQTNKKYVFRRKGLF
jgi:glycosyltransferase involved in cell wall biosynthesis